MFNKKSDNLQGTISVIGHEKTSGTSAALAPSAYANTAESNYSIINEFLVMKGDLESEADILVKGKVHGNIKCKMLIIDAGALVEGGVEADEVVVRGAAKGVLRAKRVRFEKTADVDSEIYHQSFAAEEGAKIRGALHFTSELSKPVVVAVKAKVENGAAATH